MSSWLASTGIPQTRQGSLTQCLSLGFYHFLTQRSLGTSQQQVIKNLRWIANRPTETQTDQRIGKLRNTQKNLKKPALPVVNPGPPDTKYLYYLLDVEGVTLKGSLLPAHTT